MPGYATVWKTEAKYQVLDSRESSCTCKDFLSLEEAFRFFGKCHSLRARNLPIHGRNHLIPAKFSHQQSGSYELHIQGTNAGFIGLTFWLSIMPSAILIIPPQAPAASLEHLLSRVRVMFTVLPLALTTCSFSNLSPSSNTPFPCIIIYLQTL